MSDHQMFVGWILLGNSVGTSVRFIAVSSTGCEIRPVRLFDGERFLGFVPASAATRMPGA